MSVGERPPGNLSVPQPRLVRLPARLQLRHHVLAELRVIEICRVEKCYDPKLMKIVWSCPRRDDLSQSIMGAFRAWGSEAETNTVMIPTGCAPQGYMEEEPSEWITSLDSK